MTGLLAKIRSFLASQGGNFAMMSGLVIAIIGLGGAGAVDLTRAYAAREKVQSVVDAVVLSLARYDEGVADSQQRGDTMLRSMLENAGVSYSGLSANFIVDTDQREVTGTARMTLDTVLLGAFMDLDMLDVTAESRAAMRTFQQIEMALVLDVSGSMSWELDQDMVASNPNDSRIAAVRDAVDVLLETLYDQPYADQRISVAVAPYSTSVAVGPGLWAKEKFDGLAAGFGATDAYSGGPEYAAAGSLPVTPPLGLTFSKTAIANYVDSLSVGGGTSGHLGFIWGWYTVSPNWRSHWGLGTTVPSGYNSGVAKIIVMLTDGAFNTGHDSRLTTTADYYGYFTEACQNARAQGITIYTVDMASETSNDHYLRTCSGSPQNSFDVDSRADLLSAFEEIARAASQIRLVN